MAEKKKKKQQVRGMPTTSIQSRMPSKAAKGQAGKTTVMAKSKKKKVKTKWYPGKYAEKLFGIQKRRRKKVGGGAAKQTTKQAGRIRKGAMKAGKGGTEVTKGGVYAKYEKKSKAAGSFRAARKAGCGSKEGGTFSWDGRSYSCAVAKPTKKQKAVRKAKALPGGTEEPRSYT